MSVLKIECLVKHTTDESCRANGSGVEFYSTTQSGICRQLVAEKSQVIVQSVDNI